MGLIRDGSLTTCDVLFCDWPRYGHFRQIRSERRLRYRLNQIPHASGRLHHRKYMTRLLRSRPYVPQTFLKFCPFPLRGIWVEKPFDTDRGFGISFLRNPVLWRRKDHCLQRYIEDPWLVDGRKTDARMFALIHDDGSVQVHRDALLRVARLPFSLEDLDPMIHNANVQFQMRMGVERVEQHIVSELLPNGALLDAMVGIVNDCVAMLGKQSRFGGTGDFEVMGFDFAVDGKGTPFLLEANRFPGLRFDNEVCSRFYRGMIRDLFRAL